MTSSFLLISQLLIAVAGALECAADETCLLQTMSSVQTRRDVEPHVEPVAQREVPKFEINLDLAPEERFKEVAHTFKDKYTELYEKFGKSPGIMASVKKISQLRGEEPAEFMGEIRGIAKAAGLPEYWVHAGQFIPSLQCLKGPFLKFVDAQNITLPGDSKLTSTGATTTEFLNHFQVPSFGNTGIIAKDGKDGSVWHARNLGYALPSLLQHMTYDAKFTKDGKEVFTSQMVFPLVGVFAGMRRGSDGYSFQANTRYLDSQDESMLLMNNLYLEKRAPSSWTARKTLESTDNYDDAVKLFSKTPYPNPEFNLISGVSKGTLIARDADKVAYKMDLDDKHPFLVMTNFDYVNNDKKEWLQPTRVKGVSARVRAQNLLSASDSITPELLAEVLNDRDVLSNNVLYQSMVNLKHGSFESSLPACGNCADDDVWVRPDGQRALLPTEAHAAKN